MARKNQKEILELQEAITEIKKIKMQIQNDNMLLFEEIDVAERRLLEKYYDEVSCRFSKTKGKSS